MNKYYKELVFIFLTIILLSTVNAMPMDRFFDEQNLSNDQIIQLHKNRQEQMQENKAMFATLQKKHEKLEKLLAQSKIDEKEVAKVIAEIKDINGKLVESHLNNIVNLRKIIGSDLFNKFTKEMRKGMARKFRGEQFPPPLNGAGEGLPPPPPEEK